MPRIYKTPFVGDPNTASVLIGDQELEVVGQHEDGSLLVASDEDLPADHHFERMPHLEKADAAPAKPKKPAKPAKNGKGKDAEPSDPESGQPSAPVAGDDPA